MEDLALGVNHQFSSDNDTPALLGFAENLVVENTAKNKSDFVHGKTGKIGFTTYRGIDPVFLSLTAGYRYAASREINEQSVNPGDVLFINPNLAFAINNEVTLTSGVKFRFKGKHKVDNLAQGMRTSETNLNFGIGYAASKKLTYVFNIGADISGNNGTKAGFNILYKFK